MSIGRHVLMFLDAIIDGRGVAVHYSFGAQQGREMGNGAHGMEWTDVLNRYRAYAEEMVCGRPSRG